MVYSCCGDSYWFIEAVLSTEYCSYTVTENSLFTWKYKHNNIKGRVSSLLYIY